MKWESCWWGGDGIREKGGEGSYGRKKGVRGWRSWERGALSGWLFSRFFPSFSLVGAHHVTMCNWPVVTPELCKQISRETCQPEGLLRWMCVLCESQMWDCVGNLVRWSKTYINGEQVGQLTLSQTNLLSWARGEHPELMCLCTVTHAYWIQTHSSVLRLSMLHFLSLN